MRGDVPSLPDTEPPDPITTMANSRSTGTATTRDGAGNGASTEKSSSRMEGAWAAVAGGLAGGGGGGRFDLVRK